MGHRVNQGPEDFLRLRSAPSNHLISNWLSSCNRSRSRSHRELYFRSVLRNGRQTEIQSALPDSLLFTQPEHLEGGSIREFCFRTRSQQNHTDVQVLDKVAEALLTGADSFLRFSSVGDVAHDCQRAVLPIQVNQRPGELAGADFPR